MKRTKDVSFWLSTCLPRWRDAMVRIQTYRLLTLLTVVLAAIGIFLAFFFVWVIAPVTVICVFYLVFFANEERGAIGRDRRQVRQERRKRLTREAGERRRELARRRRAADEVRPP